MRTKPMPGVVYFLQVENGGPIKISLADFLEKEKCP
jgi:hypothetical protein